MCELIEAKRPPPRGGRRIEMAVSRRGAPLWTLMTRQTCKGTTGAIQPSGQAHSFLGGAHHNDSNNDDGDDDADTTARNHQRKQEANQRRQQQPPQPPIPPLPSAATTTTVELIDRFNERFEADSKQPAVVCKVQQDFNITADNQSIDRKRTVVINWPLPSDSVSESPIVPASSTFCWQFRRSKCGRREIQNQHLYATTWSPLIKRSQLLLFCLVASCLLSLAGVGLCTPREQQQQQQILFEDATGEYPHSHDDHHHHHYNQQQQRQQEHQEQQHQRPTLMSSGMATNNNNNNHQNRREAASDAGEQASQQSHINCHHQFSQKSSHQHEQQQPPPSPPPPPPERHHHNHISGQQQRRLPHHRPDGRTIEQPHSESIRSSSDLDYDDNDGGVGDGQTKGGEFPRRRGEDGASPATSLNGTAATSERERARARQGAAAADRSASAPPCNDCLAIPLVALVGDRQVTGFIIPPANLQRRLRPPLPPTPPHEAPGAAEVGANNARLASRESARAAAYGQPSQRSAGQPAAGQQHYKQQQQQQQQQRRRRPNEPYEQSAYKLYQEHTNNAASSLEPKSDDKCPMTGPVTVCDQISSYPADVILYKLDGAKKRLGEHYFNLNSFFSDERDNSGDPFEDRAKIHHPIRPHHHHDHHQRKQQQQHPVRPMAMVVQHHVSADDSEYPIDQSANIYLPSSAKASVSNYKQHVDDDYSVSRKQQTRQIGPAKAAGYSRDTDMINESQPPQTARFERRARSNQSSHHHQRTNRGSSSVQDDFVDLVERHAISLSGPRVEQPQAHGQRPSAGSQARAAQYRLIEDQRSILTPNRTLANRLYSASLALQPQAAAAATASPERRPVFGKYNPVNASVRVSSDLDATVAEAVAPPGYDGSGDGYDDEASLDDHQSLDRSQEAELSSASQTSSQAAVASPSGAKASGMKVRRSRRQAARVAASSGGSSTMAAAAAATAAAASSGQVEPGAPEDNSSDGPGADGAADNAANRRAPNGPNISLSADSNDNQAEPVCRAKSIYISPRAALNDKKQWKYVVNAPERDPQIRQIIRVDVCENPFGPCSDQVSIPFGFTSECKQKYSKKKLLALDANSGLLEVDTFFIPSCCVCQLIRQTSPVEDTMSPLEQPPLATAAAAADFEAGTSSPTTQPEDSDESAAASAAAGE